MLTGGSVFGEFKLLSPLGRGPNARVWVATRLGRDERVVLKIIDIEKVSEQNRKRGLDALVRAITKVGRMEHANLPGVYGTAISNDDGAFGIATEYFDGGPFENMGHLGDPLILDRTLHLLIQLATLMSWLHLNEVTHGNVKPSNVLVTPGTYGPTIKLLDLCWSLADLGSGADRAFVSPEASVGEPLDELTDQWATARLLHQLIVSTAGKGRSPTQALTALPLPVLRVMKRALENSPRARYQSMAAFVQALEHAREEVLEGEERPHAVREPTIPIAFEEKTAPHAVVGRGAVPTQPGLPALDHDTDDVSTADVPTETTPTVKRLPAHRAVQMHAPGPVALASINPSADAHVEPTPYPSVPPSVQPQDPTDRYSASPAERRTPWGAAIVILIAAIVILGAGYWVITQPDLRAPEASTSTTAAPPARQTPPTKTPPTAPPPPVQAPPPAVEPPRTVEPAPPDTAPLDAELVRFQKSCEQGSASSCAKLGAKFLRGHGVKKSVPSALHWYERACKLRNTSACMKTASLFVEVGNGKRARRIYERACDARSAVACERLSALYRRGIGGRKSTRTADAFRTRACQLGLRRACD